MYVSINVSEFFYFYTIRFPLFSEYKSSGIKSSKGIMNTYIPNKLIHLYWWILYLSPITNTTRRNKTENRNEIKKTQSENMSFASETYWNHMEMLKTRNFVEKWRKKENKKRKYNFNFVLDLVWFAQMLMHPLVFLFRFFSCSVLFALRYLVECFVLRPLILSSFNYFTNHIENRKLLLLKRKVFYLLSLFHFTCLKSVFFIETHTHTHKPFSSPFSFSILFFVRLCILYFSRLHFTTHVLWLTRKTVIFSLWISLKRKKKFL